MTAGNQNVHPTFDNEGNVRGMGELTKREYFAAIAMQGYISCNPTRMGDLPGVAINAVKAADELISELNKPTE